LPILLWLALVLRLHHLDFCQKDGEAILDCCYSGAAKLSKGHEDDAAKIGIDALRSKARILQDEQQGEGKCLLAASQAAQEAYGLKKQEHSIFTYYLLEGLRGNERSVDINGNVTPYSLGSYVYKAILNLPPKKRPKQKPVTKVEASGDIILASYPDLIKRDSSAILTPISSSGLLFYSLLPEQVLQSTQQERVSSRSPTSSPYALDEARRKTKGQYVATPIRPKAEGKKQLLSISKVMMPIVVVVVSSIVAFVFIGAIQTQPHNHLPSATDESVTTKMNTPVNTTLEGRDLDKNNTITAAIITPPSHGTLGDINQVSGVVTYTPNRNFVGNDSFTYNVNDGKIDSSNIALVKIRVGFR
jgi:Bacterial Ig domain